MCGIAGLVVQGGTTSADRLRAQVAAMMQTMVHRGPDGGGVWVDASAGVAFGHRRLAILDLSATAAQPMVSANGRYVVNFNGEVFNVSALRQELETAGVCFKSRSDTEVVLEGFVYWGIEPTIARLVGMFAIAVWDSTTRTLTLIRDRLGIKPLFYANIGRRFLFGSEIKALVAAGDWAPTLDCGALASYLRLSYVPAPATIFREATKLPPGCILTLANGKPEVLTRYWDMHTIAVSGLAAARSSAESDEDAIDHLDILLRDAVRKCMIADVPLGAFLSGGIDSSTVVALMQAESERPVKTFSIGFHESGYDEAAHARQVAGHVGSDHTEIYIDPRDAIEIIPSLPDMFDEPFADPSEIATHLVARIARPHVTIALSGDGGDEVFAGYRHYLWGEQVWRRLNHIPIGVRRCGAAAARHALTLGGSHILAMTLGRQKAARISAGIAKAAGVMGCDRPDQLYHCMRSRWHDHSELAVHRDLTRDMASAQYVASDIPGLTERMQFFDSVTYLPDDVLTKLDRASMQVGLEARVPLLDYRLVEFAWRQPLGRKLRDGSGKWLLKQVLFRHVPAALIDRPKTGFNVPVGRWLRGPLRSWAEDLLEPRRLAADGLLRPDLVARLWREHLLGHRDWQAPLWAVLAFQQWRQHPRTGSLVCH